MSVDETRDFGAFYCLERRYCRCWRTTSFLATSESQLDEAPLQNAFLAPPTSSHIEKAVVGASPGLTWSAITNIYAVQPRTGCNRELHGSIRSVLPVQLPHWHIGLVYPTIIRIGWKGCLAVLAWTLQLFMRGRPVSSKQGT